MTLIRLGHSPDPDDAFMFYALAKDLIPTHGFEFEHVLRDIETLNRWAMEGRLEVTAISVHAYASVADKYRLLVFRGRNGRYTLVDDFVTAFDLNITQLREEDGQLLYCTRSGKPLITRPLAAP